ncbi:hypothetical protein F4781DRAFT_433813 [Annulohypoxylon bovei var. microspora]|nr:hypothetical protein F4781DRAFT_433813 [Annulohypoxylon bovei var. microspora]
MAGIGEASAIAGLFSLGIQVTKALYSVADGIGAAGEEVRDVARDVNSAIQTMKSIQGVLDKQPHINNDINAVVTRIADICGQIFRIYDVLQKSLVPLLERFRDSKKKLEQFGLRLKWYLRSKAKVTGCRHALQRQIAMLTPILTLLCIDRVQSIQVKNILENNTANLHHTDNNGLRRLNSTESPHLTLPPPAKDISTDKQESRGTSTTEDTNQTTSTTIDETSNDHSTLTRYELSNSSGESISPEEAEEAEETGRQVKEALDRGLEIISDRDMEIIVIETCSVEIQFSKLVRQILADLEEKEAHTSPEPASSPNLKSPSPEVNEVWSRIEKPDGSCVMFPYDALNTSYKLLLALRDLGYNITSPPKIRREFDSDSDECESIIDARIMDRDYDDAIIPSDNHADVLRDVLRRIEIEITNVDGGSILPRFWDRYFSPGMVIKLRSTTVVPKDEPASEKVDEKIDRETNEKRGLMKRLGKKPGLSRIWSLIT